MKKIQEADILQDLAPQAKNVVKLQRDAAIKAALKAAKASTGILTPARKAAKEKAKLAKAVAQKLQQAGTNPTDLEIMKIAGLESSQNLNPTLEEAKKGLDATKAKWISKIGGNKAEVSSFVNKKVKELEDRYGDNYEAIVGTLKKILQRKYPNVNLEEESQGGITTSNVGSQTTANNEPAPFGSSAIFAPKIGSMMSRRGDIPQKKKKEKIRKFVEYYFQ